MAAMRIERFISMKQMTFAAAIAISLATPAIARAADPAPVARDYSRYCESCHGSKGRGDGPRAHLLEAPPDDLSDCVATRKISDPQFFQAIQQGGMAVGMSPEMPAWGGALDPAQIKALVAYVRGFCRNREASPSPPRTQ
jgi:mono/diheme cytochrome c family protein